MICECLAFLNLGLFDRIILRFSKGFGYGNIFSKVGASVGKESEKQDIISATTKIFKLIGDPTRFLILHMLENRELNVNAIADELQLEQSAVSHQLRKLREAKLVKSRRIGKNILYSQDDSHVYDILHLAVEHARHGFEEGNGAPD